MCKPWEGPGFEARQPTFRVPSLNSGSKVTNGVAHVDVDVDDVDDDEDVDDDDDD